MCPRNWTVGRGAAFSSNRTPRGAAGKPHLHLIQAGNSRWVEQLRFRDALRADSGLAQKYADLKYRLVELSGHDREAYAEGKADFVACVLGRRGPV